MKISPLLQQFWQYLPRFTNLFTATISITSLTATGGTATAVSVGHGLLTGAAVNITGAVQIADVSSAFYDNDTGIFTLETTQNHGHQVDFDFKRGAPADLGSTPPKPVTVEIEGFNESEFNGAFTQLTVPNRKKLTCQLAVGIGLTPSGSGKILNYSFNPLIGIKTITVLDVDTFTYPIETTATIDTTGNILAHHQFRIQAAINNERAVAMYTKQASSSGNPDNSNFLLFLTYGAQTVSKERLILNDTNTTIRGGTRRRQRLIDTFNVVVFAPTSNELAAVATRDKMDDVEVAIFRTMLYLPTEDRFDSAENFFYNFDSATDVFYNGAYLVRQWVFQAQYDITDLDGFNDAKRVPFLDINGSLNEEFQLSIDLDEVPL